MKKEKGITLVALIITIVVMLILVAVSVNVIVNSNLISEKEKAGVVEEKHNWQFTDETRRAINCKCDLCK